jgi:hypothetical protein
MIVGTVAQNTMSRSGQLLAHHCRDRPCQWAGESSPNGLAFSSGLRCSARECSRQVEALNFHASKFVQALLISFEAIGRTESHSKVAVND